MAFIDFRLNDTQPIACLSPVVETLTARAEPLSVLERRVVERARDDRLTSLQPSRPRSWLGRLVFGPQPPSPMLANERLEALRRLAVVAWHEGYQLPASALREAQAAGFTETQTGAVVDLVARLQAPVRRLAA